MNTFLISGCGDIGIRVARCLRQQVGEDIMIYGLVRRKEVVHALNAESVIPVIADLDKPESLDLIPTSNATIFHLAPPPNDTQGENKTRDPRFRALLKSCETNGLPKKIILLSTTAVYGDCDGNWIDESAEVNPQTDRGRRRLDAELALREWANAREIPFVIIRVSGIYGPGRLPIERLKKGLPILREDLAPFSNRIHQDDLAAICVAAAQRAPDGSVYNACDGHPSTMSHYFKSIAEALNLPMPPELDREQAEKQLSAGMLSYLRESRRMDKKKVLEELKISLQYPDLDSGLKNISIQNS